MFKDFPSLHPLAVHFPIVLILLAAAFQSVLVWKDLKQIKWVTLIIMAGAFFSSLAASTIFHAEPSADAPKAALEIFNEHEKYAQLTLWVSGITLLLKSIGIFFKINRRLYEVIVLIAAIIAAVFLSIAGHHGAKLTHVAGVGPMGRYLMKGHGDAENMDMKSDSVMKMTDTMPGMKNMDNLKMDSSMNMKGMKTMNGMDKMKEMKNMPSMNNMPGMNNKKEMKAMKMDASMNMNDMNNMPGMNIIKMDSSMNMKDMKKMDMPGMSNMNMPKINPMDTLRFPDNNPARKKNYKQQKQQ